MFAPSAWLRPYPNGPGWPSESAFTTYPPKSGMRAYTRRVVAAHHARTSPSSGSALGSPPSRTGAAKLTDRCTRMPYGRSTSAIHATSSSRSVSRCASVWCTLTLLTATALIPVAASNRPYARTRAWSRRARPSCQKMDPPEYPRST